MDPKLHDELSRLSRAGLISLIHDLVKEMGKDGAKFLTERVEQLRCCWTMELPQQYFCVILTQWLSLADVTHLDSAMCNTKLRLRYLSCYEKGYVVFPSYPSFPKLAHDELLRWLINRHVKLRSIDLFNFASNFSAVHPFIEAAGRSLHSVDLTGSQGLQPASFLLVVDCCQNLKELRLSKCSFKMQINAVETAFSRFPSLKLLDISGAVCGIEGPDGGTTVESGSIWINMQNMSIAATHLEIFLADDHARLTDEIMLNIYGNCNRLCRVSLNHCANLSADGFQQLPMHCPNLVELCANQTQLDDATLLLIARRCRNFCKLSAARCLHITDTGVLALLDSCPVLSTLELDHNHSITDQVMLCLYPSCPLMQVLSVSGCSSLTVSGVMTPIKLCPLLQTFRILDFPPDFDMAVRTELYNGKYWLGNWKDRKLTIMQTSKV